MGDFDVIATLVNYNFIVDKAQEIIKKVTHEDRNVSSIYVAYSLDVENDEPEFNSRHIVNVNKPKHIVTTIRVIYGYSEDNADHAIEFPSDWFFLSSEELDDECRKRYERREAFLSKVHGKPHWNKLNNPNYSPFDNSFQYNYICSECGHVSKEGPTKYCSSCGTQMDEV